MGGHMYFIYQRFSCGGSRILHCIVLATTQKRKRDAKRVQRGDGETEERNCTDNSVSLTLASRSVV
jgi:hypothetical protein